MFFLSIHDIRQHSNVNKNENKTMNIEQEPEFIEIVIYGL